MPIPRFMQFSNEGQSTYVNVDHVVAVLPAKPERKALGWGSLVIMSNGSTFDYPETPDECWEFIKKVYAGPNA